MVVVAVVLVQERRKLLASPSQSNGPPPRPTPRNVITSALNTTKQRTQAIQRTIISAFPSRSQTPPPIATHNAPPTRKLSAIVKPTPASRMKKQSNGPATAGRRLAKLLGTPPLLCGDSSVQPYNTGAEPYEEDTPQERPPIYTGTPEHRRKLEWWEHDATREDRWSVHSDAYQEVADDSCSEKYVNAPSSSGREYKDQDLHSQLSDCTYDDISSMVEEEVMKMRESNETELHAETIESSLNSIYNSYVNSYPEDAASYEIHNDHHAGESMREDSSIVLSVQKLDTTHRAAIHRHNSSFYGNLPPPKPPVLRSSVNHPVRVPPRPMDTNSIVKACMDSKKKRGLNI